MIKDTDDTNFLNGVYEMYYNFYDIFYNDYIKHHSPMIYEILSYYKIFSKKHFEKEPITKDNPLIFDSTFMIKGFCPSSYNIFNGFNSLYLYQGMNNLNRLLLETFDNNEDDINTAIKQIKLRKDTGSKLLNKQLRIEDPHGYYEKMLNYIFVYNIEISDSEQDYFYNKNVNLVGNIVTEYDRKLSNNNFVCLLVENYTSIPFGIIFKQGNYPYAYIFPDDLFELSEIKKFLFKLKFINE